MTDSDCSAVAPAQVQYGLQSGCITEQAAAQRGAAMKKLLRAGISAPKRTIRALLASLASEAMSR